MRILILTQWYPPEPALLLQELAQSLINMGHDVQVLTGFPNYPSGTLYPGYKLRWRMKEVLAGVPVARVALFPDHSTSKIKRSLNYLSFAFSSAFLGPWLVDRPDVIFVYHPPLTVGFSGFLLSRLWRVPFVYQIQDMWPETLAATGMISNQRILKWIDVSARWIYRQAKTILVISPGFKRNLIKKQVPAEKIHVISNWVDTDLYHPKERDVSLAQELGFAGKFNIMFAGNMGRAQGLETVLDAAAILVDHRDVQFVFVGDGVAESQLRAQAEEKQLTNVRFLGRYPAAEMPKLYAMADVLLVHLKNDPLFRITIPHKIMVYLAMGKPVLAAVLGDAADVVKNTGAGFTCPPEDANALAEAVLTFFQLSEEERRAMGARALHAAHSMFSRDTLTAQIEAVLRAAASKDS